MPTRRDILLSTLVAPAALMLGAGTGRARTLPATPNCDAGAAPTLAQTEGPFFKPNTPERRNFRTDGEGAPFAVTGFILDRSCAPLPGAVVELWHADAGGEYDNAGFRFRGHQRADEKGRFLFETIRPAAYGFRTPHFHIKAQSPSSDVLTTQFYFPDEAKNLVDFIHDSALEMRIDETEAGLVGRYDIVLAV